MTIRKLPYGYTLIEGIIVIDPTEGKNVLSIFEGYVGGASFGCLAQSLSEQGVVYQGTSTNWNKNIIARILENQKYTGQQNYPRIISEDLFREAASVRKKKQSPSATPSEIKLIGIAAECQKCGHVLRRYMAHAPKERWVCDHCNSIPTSVTDEQILDNTLNTLNTLISNRAVIDCPRTQLSQSLDTMRIQNELDRIINDPSRDEAQVKLLIMELAAAKYAQLRNSDYETERIRCLLAAATPTDELDIDLLGKIVEKVIVGSDCSVALKLKNGQIIERN